MNKFLLELYIHDNPGLPAFKAKFMIIKSSQSIDEMPYIYMLCHSIICVTKLPSNCQKQSWNAPLFMVYIYVMLWYAPSPSDISLTSCCLSVFQCPACFLWFCFLSIYLSSLTQLTNLLPIQCFLTKISCHGGFSFLFVFF